MDVTIDQIPKVPYQAELDLYDFQPSSQFWHTVRNASEGGGFGEIHAFWHFLLGEEH